MSVPARVYLNYAFNPESPADIICVGEAYIGRIPSITWYMPLDELNIRLGERDIFHTFPDVLMHLMMSCPPGMDVPSFLEKCTRACVLRVSRAPHADAVTLSLPPVREVRVE